MLARVLVTVATASVLCGCAPAAPLPTEEAALAIPTDAATQAVLRAIQAQWADHVRGGLAFDVDVAIRQFADDVILIEPGAEPVVGLTAFREMERTLFAEQQRAGLVKLSRDRQVVALRVFGEVAYEIGTNRIRDRARSGEETTQLYHYMVSWRRQTDGTWKVHRIVVGGAPLP